MYKSHTFRKITYFYLLIMIIGVSFFVLSCLAYCEVLHHYLLWNFVPARRLNSEFYQTKIKNIWQCEELTKYIILSITNTRNGGNISKTPISFKTRCFDPFYVSFGY